MIKLLTPIGWLLGFLIPWISSTHMRWQVGLWGSCDPTKWRATQLIPLLEKWGITYFNPQIDKYEEALAAHYAENEREALDTVKVHFTVIDGLTRGLVSLFELYHVVLLGLPFIAVISDLKYGAVIDGQRVSDFEAELINEERQNMRELIQAAGLPVFKSIWVAALHIPLALIFPNWYRCKDVDKVADKLGLRWRKPSSTFAISEDPSNAVNDIFTAVVTAYMWNQDLRVVFPRYLKWEGKMLKDGTLLQGRRLKDWQRLFHPYAHKFVRSGRSTVQVVYPD